MRIIILTLVAIIGHTTGTLRSVTADDSKAKQETADLTIELRLPKHEYKTSESVDVEIIFRNQSKKELKIPMIEGEQKLLFFDFLILGDRGTQFLTSNSNGWFDPSKKPVKLLRIGAGDSKSVTLKNVLPFRMFDAGIIVNERYKLIAIYRDHSHGHSSEGDPTAWKGFAISAPVTIKRLTIDREKK